MRALHEIEGELTPSSMMVVSSVMLFAAIAFMGMVLLVMSLMPEAGLILIGLLLCLGLATFILYGPVTILLKVYRDWNRE